MYRSFHPPSQEPIVTEKHWGWGGGHPPDGWGSGGTKGRAETAAVHPPLSFHPLSASSPFSLLSDGNQFPGKCKGVGGWGWILSSSSPPCPGRQRQRPLSTAAARGHKTRPPFSPSPTPSTPLLWASPPPRRLLFLQNPFKKQDS